jgi:CheY-like chemotaxis protein
MNAFCTIVEKLDQGNFVLLLASIAAAIVLGVYLIGLLRRPKRFSEQNSSGGKKIASENDENRLGKYVHSSEEREKSLNWENGEKSSERAAAPDSNSGVKTALVADDEPVVSMALSNRLKRLGFNVVQSPDAAHALLGALKISPDLIIMDVNMPSGNGLAAAEMIVSDPRYRHIPIIIHSILNDELILERCRNIGVEYVEKSSKSWSKIKAIIETHFGKSENAGDTAAESAKGPMQDAGGKPRPEPTLSAKMPEETAVAAVKENLPPLGSDDQSLVNPHLPVCGHARFLCIDSDEGELDLFETRLSGLGAEITRMHDPEAGFWTCFTDKPHAVIMQFAKNSQKLQEVLARFVVHPFTKNIPVIFINHESAIPIDDLPTGDNFQVVNSPIAWHDFVEVLEKIVPVSTPQKNDPLSKPRDAGEDNQAARESSTGERTEPSGSGGEPAMRILCIDDDPLIAQSMAIRMNPYGIQVTGIENGMGGYLQAVAKQPDAILLDMQMPNGDGHYVLSKLKEHSRTKDIPVIILTMETNQGVRRQMVNLGAAGFLSKPVRWNALFEELGNHVPLPKKAVEDYELKHGALAMAYE